MLQVPRCPRRVLEPEDFGKEFKRLPVRMRLWMDQRWLPHLISECANAPLQVEVQEVRINVADDAAAWAAVEWAPRAAAAANMACRVVTRREEMTPETEPYMKSSSCKDHLYLQSSDRGNCRRSGVATTA